MTRRVVSVVVDDFVIESIHWGQGFISTFNPVGNSREDQKRNALQALFAGILKVWQNPKPVRISEFPPNEHGIVEVSNEHDEVWRTRDGRAIRVCDMDDDHVRSTLNMLLRNRRRRVELKRELKALSQWAEESLEDEKKWGSS